MPQRRGNGRRRATVNRLAREVNRLKLTDTYTFPRGRADPPRIVSNPRWPLVLDTVSIQKDAGTSAVTNSSIRTAVRGQLGLPQTFELFELFFHRVDLWTTPQDVVSGNASLALRLCDWDSGSYGPWVEDQGTTSRPGHVHATWPKSQAVVPRSSGDSNVLQIDSPGQFTATLHVHLWISFTGGDVLPTVRRRLMCTYVPHPLVL